MAPSQAISAFSTIDKAAHNHHRFAFNLTPTNYGYWKTMVQPFLSFNGLMGYVDGSIICPEKFLPFVNTTTIETSNAAPKVSEYYLNWVSDDAHVRMLLISTISEASFRHVQGTTSRDLWLSLEKAYVPHTSSIEYTLKTQLLKIGMYGDESTEHYLNRAQEYVDAIAAIGEPIKDKDLVMLTIAGLRDEYNSLKSTINARQFATSFSGLQGLLSDHDFMLGKTRASGPTTTHVVNTTNIGQHSPSGLSSTGASTSITSMPSQNVALNSQQQLVAQASSLGFQLIPKSAANHQAFFGNRQSNHNRGGRRGNFRANARGIFRGNRADNRFSWASTQNTIFGSCSQCGIRHIPSQCPNRNDRFTTRDTRDQQSANFAAHRHGSTTSTNWFADTGANRHVTPDSANLDNASAYSGLDSLHVGNGQSHLSYPPYWP